MRKNIIEKIHEECPNETHCEKDNEKCMYLIGRKCIIKEARTYGKPNNKR